LELAASSVGRFLTCENNNLKYLGINALISIINVNAKYCVEHQMTVVECLENQDETLKRKTFQLLFKMTNSTNVEIIVEKLINFLK
jgi:AP-4 complex subunit epsilon-1